MLFVETKVASHTSPAAGRLSLLEKLQEKGLVPLIRSTRLSCFEQALMGPERSQELERVIATRVEAEGETPYIRGDLFCFEDFVLFLIFADVQESRREMRAGIIYGSDASDPLKKLDTFCRNVDDALRRVHNGAISSSGSNGNSGNDSGNDSGKENPEGNSAWRSREQSIPAGFTRFTATEDHGSLSEMAREKSSHDQKHAADLLEDSDARRFLRRVREAYADGRMADLLVNNEGHAGQEPLVKKLSDSGLLKREVVVSCRKTGRSLFRLPSPDALNVITASAAMCSECGMNIADEKVDELLAPTERSTKLLENGIWLTSRLHSALLELGVPEPQIRISEPAENGEAHMLVAICGEIFLFALRDGEWTASHARRAINLAVEMEASHLIVIATGRIQEESRVKLRDHTRRQARGGREIEINVVEGVDTAIAQLTEAFERVSEKALAEELCALDASLGLSAGQVIAARFQLMQKSGALQDLAASAAGAVAGRLSEV